MPLWGNTDDAANSVISAPAQFKQAPTRANANLLYGNTTQDAVVSGQTVGMYGVDTTEMSVGSGPLVDVTITFPGSGYGANATVAFSSNNTGSSAAANAQANSSGRISVVNITNNGSGYTTSPILTIAAPSAVVFNGNTAVSGNTIALTSANSKFLVGDKVRYAGNTLSTPVGMTDNTDYFISFSNTTVVALSATLGGANLTISKASGDSSTAGGATLTGETATAAVTVGGAKNRGIAHAGWVVRTEGTGGRAGRVQYETLVAMGSMSGDGSDDNPLPDA
jgi:hypothetical protein